MLRNNSAERIATLLIAKQEEKDLSKMFTHASNFNKYKTKTNSGWWFKNAAYLKYHRDASFLQQKAKKTTHLPLAHPDNQYICTLFYILFNSAYSPGEDPRFLYSESDEDDSCYEPHDPQKSKLHFIKRDTPSTARRILDRELHLYTQTEKAAPLDEKPQSSTSTTTSLTPTQARLRATLEKRRKEKEEKEKQQAKKTDLGACGETKKPAATPFTLSDFEDDSQTKDSKSSGKKKKKKQKHIEEKEVQKQQQKQTKKKVTHKEAEQQTQAALLTSHKIERGGVKPKSPSKQKEKQTTTEARQANDKQEVMEKTTQKIAQSSTTFIPSTQCLAALSDEYPDIQSDTEDSSPPLSQSSDYDPYTQQKPFMPSSKCLTALNFECPEAESDSEGTPPLSQCSDFTPYNSGDEEEASLPITTQQQHVEQTRHDTHQSLVENFNSENQFCSLQNIHYVLLNTSEQILNTLKGLVLKSNTNQNKNNLLYYAIAENNQLSFELIEELQKLATYTFFADMDNYITNLENKVQSGRAGITINLLSGLNFSSTLNLSFIYDFNKNISRENTKLSDSNSNNSSIKSKTETNGFATVISLNPNTKGFTGNIAGYSSWGNVKNVRKTLHGPKNITTKGNPDALLNGGLLQLGYNIPTLKTLIVTPYIETIVATVQWKSYQEKGTLYLSKISKNKNRIIENSIGLRSNFLITNKSRLQTAVYYTIGKTKTDKLTAITKIAPMIECFSYIYSNKNTYTKTVVDISYEIKLTELLHAGLNSSITFDNKKSFTKNSITIYFEYIY